MEAKAKRHVKKMQYRLNQRLPQSAIKQKQGGGGRKLDYVNSGTLIQAMNDSVGNLGWNTKLILLEKAFERQVGSKINLGFRATVAVEVIGHNAHTETAVSNLTGEESNYGDLLDNAAKSAVTDATKRAIRLFGPGLDLYKPVNYVVRKMDKKTPKRLTTATINERRVHVPPGAPVPNRVQPMPKVAPPKLVRKLEPDFADLETVEIPE